MALLGLSSEVIGLILSWLGLALSGPALTCKELLLHVRNRPRRLRRLTRVIFEKAKEFLNSGQLVLFRGSELGMPDGWTQSLVDMLLPIRISGLDLNCNSINAKGFCRLTNWLAANRTTLTSLDVGYNSICMQGTKALAHVLPSIEDLRILDLGDNTIGDGGLAVLCPALRQCGKLTSLNIGLNQIQDIGPLASVLPSIEDLRILDLNRNKIGDGGLAVLCPALRQCRKLTSLNIGLNQIKDIGPLPSVLPQCGNLTRLDLNYNKIGNAGAKALAEVLPRTGLVHLGIGVMCDYIITLLPHNGETEWSRLHGAIIRVRDN